MANRCTIALMGNGELLDAIDALEPSPFEHAIIEKFVCLDRLMASLVADLDSFDRDGMWAVCGATSLRNWLTTSCSRTDRDARSFVRYTRLLRSLPHTAAAFADGTLSKGHVDVIAGTLTDKTVSEFAQIEAGMIGPLSALSVTEATGVMKLWAAHAKAATGTDDGEPDDDVETDHLHVSELMGGAFKLDGALTGTNAIVVNEAIALCMPEPVEGEPVRPLSQRRADALVEMARRVLQTTNSTTRRSSDALLLIPFDTFVNGGVATYADGTTVSPDRVRRLLCDAVITPLLQGDAGQPLWMGRSVRTATDAQRRALVARDRHCAFPGCYRPVSWTEAHHIQYWDRDQGPTDIDNMCLLCTTHHDLLHQPGWHAKLTPEQTLHVTTPAGRVLRAPPPTHVHRIAEAGRRRQTPPMHRHVRNE
jgi:Domain of unknown function (DUF222)/HNH endonuclease